MALTYNISADGTYYTVNGGGDSGKTTLTGIVEIPNTYNGLPVKEIEDNAFTSFSKITEVVIPNSITRIGKEAFRYSSMTKVNVPGSLKTMGNYIFGNCSKLISVTLEQGVPYLGHGIFYSCTALPSIAIPDSVTYGGGHLFMGCSKIQEIILPETFKYFGSPNAFWGMTNLKNFYFGKAFNNFHLTNPFGNCSLLEKFEVNPENTYIRVENNCVIRNSDNMLLQGTYKSRIPTSASGLAIWSFCTQYNLKSIVIPANINYIGNDCFGTSTNLEYVLVKGHKDNFKTIGNIIFKKTKVEKVNVLSNKGWSTGDTFSDKDPTPVPIEIMQTGAYPN